MLGYDIDPWMCHNLRCIPATHGELMFLEFACMLLFAAIAGILTLLSTVVFSLAFSILYICRSGIGSGATFPLSVLFVLYPVSQNVRNLFSYEQMLIALM